MMRVVVAPSAPGSPAPAVTAADDAVTGCVVAGRDVAVSCHGNILLRILDAGLLT